MGLCDYAMGDYMSALMNIDKAFILSDDDEYLQNKYNEIKEILEKNKMNKNKKHELVQVKDKRQIIEKKVFGQN